MSFKFRLEEKVLGPKSQASSSLENKDFDLAIGHKGIGTISKNNLNRVEGEFLEKMGNVIRNPIHGIIESVDLLKEGMLTSHQTLQLNSISNSSNNLLEIINELLEYSKLTSGREKCESIDFNFYSIIKDTLYLCNTLIINKNVGLEVDLDTEIPEILNGDPSKLSQILLTLLGNSIKLIDEGSILLKIKLRKQNRNNCLLDFEITDSGTGTVKNKFESNTIYPKNPETNFHDSGISLAIVKGTIEILNGSMAKLGTLGNSCAFKFTVPYNRCKEIKVSATLKDSFNRNTEFKNIEGLHVLVFEGNILVQKIIEQRLVKWGCIVYVTHNGEDGLEYLHKNSVDLVLMDLRMPEMNGFHVAQRIRETFNSHIPNIPIIALTADVTITDKNKCKALGIDDYILKPYSPEELLNTLYKYKKETKTKPGIEPNNEVSQFSIKKETFELSLSGILEECMGEIDLLEELIGLFKQNMLDFIGRANIYIPEGNFSRLGFAAHTVKTGLSMMKADKLYFLVDEIVVCCRTDRDLPKIGRLYDQLLLTYPMMEKAIDRELMLLKNKRK